VGIQTDHTDRVVFHASAFAVALAADADGAPARLSTAAHRFAARLTTVADAASNPRHGTVTAAINDRRSDIVRLQTSIALDLRLTQRRETLNRQLTALETATDQMSRQSSWLAGQLSSLPASCDRLALGLTRGLEAQHTGDAPAAHRELLHAQEAVLELRTGLRATGREGGRGLASLYDYLHLELVQANVTGDPRLTEGCLDLVTDLVATPRRPVMHAARQA
jgi:hypothetical protein